MENAMLRILQSLLKDERAFADRAMTLAWPIRFITLLMVIAVASPTSAQLFSIVGTAYVVDGDSIKIDGGVIRLHGIDAPELSQPCVRLTGERWRCGLQAGSALDELIGGAIVSCQSRGQDRYNRMIAVCFKGTEDLSRWMVANGWAVADQERSSDYVSDEAVARVRRINIWSGAFCMPWNWRKKSSICP